jgi:ribonuclease HII
MVKADRYCASVAAASVLAKTHRDALLAELATRYPGYGWERNTAYLTASHREAIGRLGLTPEHRQSWNLLA